MQVLMGCALVMSGAGGSEGAAIREEVVCYAAPGGVPLRMTLFRPAQPSAAPVPAMVLIHGGAWIGGWRQQLNWFGREYARAGLVAVSIEYRKLPQYGFPECVQDAKSAVRWLRAHAKSLNVDPECILASGHSAGGYIAMMLACTAEVPELEGTENPGYSSAIQGVVSVYGAVDLEAYREPEMNKVLGGLAMPLLTRFLRNMADAGSDPLVAASPGRFVHAAMCPVLFIHGDRDVLVPRPVAHALHEGLLELGVPTKFVTFHRRGHSFERFSLPARRQVFREVLTFFGAQGLLPELPQPPR